MPSTGHSRARRRTLRAILASATALSLIAPVAWAGTGGPSPRERAEVEDQLSRARLSRAEVFARLDDLRARATALGDVLARRRSALDLAMQEFLVTAELFRDTSLQVLAAQIQLDDRARAMYQMGPLAEFGMMLSAQDTSDMLSINQYMARTMRTDAATIAALQRARTDLAARRAEVERRQVRLINMEDASQQALAAVRAELADVEWAAAEAGAEVTRLRRERSAILDAIHEAELRARRLRAERERAAAAAAAAERALAEAAESAPEADQLSELIAPEPGTYTASTSVSYPDAYPPPPGPDPALPNGPVPDTGMGYGDFPQAALLELLGPTGGRTCEIPPGLRDTGATVQGLATWYGDPQGTAAGVPFDPTLFTAAHRTLPLGTFLRIHNGNRCAILLVNDRGPYGDYDRVIDVALSAGRYLGIGVSQVTAEVLVPA